MSGVFCSDRLSWRSTLSRAQTAREARSAFSSGTAADMRSRSGCCGGRHEPLAQATQRRQQRVAIGRRPEPPRQAAEGVEVASRMQLVELSGRLGKALAQRPDCGIRRGVGASEGRVTVGQRPLEASPQHLGQRTVMLRSLKRQPFEPLPAHRIGLRCPGGTQRGQPVGRRHGRVAR